MNKIGIYLHFPFCRKKCFYCDFYSLPCLEKASLYEKNMIRFLQDLPPQWQNREADSIYLGGGTPSLASCEGIRGIFGQLKKSFCLLKDCEITSEVNPESASPEKLRALHESGVNRLSIGMQSGDDGELQRIGRIHRFADTKSCVASAREAGFENISLDLMYGLPGQSLESWRESIKKALLLGANHISFYCLTLSESVPLYSEISRLPDEEIQREMYFEAIRLLENAGFCQYEISNAALPGRESRHNEKYWDRAEVLGIGAGAYSFYQGERFDMEKNLDWFISHSNWADKIQNRERISPEDALTETIMLSLRTARGLDLAALTPLCDGEKAQKIEKKLAALVPAGLARITPRGFALTKEGFFVSNEIICELI